MGAFLVERYWPGVTETDAVALGTALSTLDDADVRYLGVILCIGDEVAMVRFTGPDADAVVAAAGRAGLRCDRIVPAVFIDPG
jgi:hypothetical protein